MWEMCAVCEVGGYRSARGQMKRMCSVHLWRWAARHDHLHQGVDQGRHFLRKATQRHDSLRCRCTHLGVVRGGGMEMGVTDREWTAGRRKALRMKALRAE
jgi:hypothetical protein